MFWGLNIESGKRYSQVVEEGFHVSMAALEYNSTEADKHKNVSVMVESEKVEYLLCSLKHGVIAQQNLDLNFGEGEDISFFLNGPGIVHLTGFMISDGDDNDFDTDYSDDDDDDDDDEKLSLEEKTAQKRKQIAALSEKSKKKPKLDDLPAWSDETDDEDEDDTDSDEEESSPNTSAIAKKQNNKQVAFEMGGKRKNKQQQKSPNQQQQKKQQQEAKTPNKQAVTNGETTPGSESKKKKRNRNRRKSQGDTSISGQTPAKTLKTPNQNAKQTPKTPNQNAKQTPKPESAKATPKPGQEGRKQNAATPGKGSRKIAGGTTVEDITAGNGPVAKRGKFVQIAYVGKLTNNQVFDSAKKGEPLGFRVGSGEVIKGLDNGIEGMKVGGKRKLTIPANQAYGRDSQGPIPPNSTLIFEVELKSVK